jgi:polyvinyl alcohol dehydrogenase (cytochrome)
MRTRSISTLFSLAMIVAIFMIAAAAIAQNATWWPVAGQNLFNTHSQPLEDQISPANVGTLVQKWSLETAGNVTATPAVYQGVLYVPDMGGRLWAVTADSGKVRWSRSISSYTGIANDVSRTTPAIAGKAIILGDGWIRNTVTAGAHVFAVDRQTGNLLWLTKVHEHLTAIITSSPVVDNGVAYVGIASKEEGVSGTPGYECCTFRGAVVALDVLTGRILWKSYMTPSNNNDSDINLPGYYRLSTGSAAFSISGPPTISPRPTACARHPTKPIAMNRRPTIISIRSLRCGSPTARLSGRRGL